VPVATDPGPAPGGDASPGTAATAVVDGSGTVVDGAAVVVLAGAVVAVVGGSVVDAADGRRVVERVVERVGGRVGGRVVAVGGRVVVVGAAVVVDAGTEVVVVGVGGGGGDAAAAIGSTTEPAEPVKSGLPAKVAWMVRLPAAGSVIVQAAFPLGSSATDVQAGTPTALSVNPTAPLGVPAPGATAATFAV